MLVYWDVESFSQRNLKECGVYIYTADRTTGVHFFCYAVDDGEVQVWKPGDAVPAPFADPAGHMFVADNWTFEEQILTHILIPQYGFSPIPIGNQDCAQRRALANAYPAELGLRCEALGLPYRKDPDAHKAMLRLSRPQKCNKPEDPAAHARDLALLLERCKTDVAATRACYNSPLLRPLLPEERRALLEDAEINARGIRANIPFLEAAQTLAVKERNAVNVRLDELTAGVVTSVFQRDRIIEAVNARGHNMTGLTKRSVSATLAHKPEEFVRELLTLRQRGAFASVQKFKKLQAFADSNDGRIRGVLRIYGAGPGRWTCLGAQLHNLKRNDAEQPASLVDALIAGNHAELARFGNPLEVVGNLSRALLCSASKHTLICADLSAIESRILAWFAGEAWKLIAFREYDVSGDEQLHPYRRIAAQMLRKRIDDIRQVERQMGKSAELACGFGGSVRAWRRIAGDDGRIDAEITDIIKKWRAAHPAIRKFWVQLARAARVAIRTKKSVLVAPAPQPPIIAAFDGQALTLTLPAGRAINYPGARLMPNTKFEDGDPDIEFFDNAHGQWKRVRAWFGVLVENCVQGAARDLLRDALLRFKGRGLPVVFHCHDEVVVEVPEGCVSEQEVLTILLEPPAWAAGLPLGGKVHSGPLYLEAPAMGEPPPPKDEELVERAVDAFVASAEPTKEIERGAENAFLASLDDTTAPLTDLVSLPMDSSHRVSCPFHDDSNPSCSIYPDHYYCHACGARGDRLDWLTQVEGMTRAEALGALHDWDGHATVEQKHSAEEKLDYALSFWNAAGPLVGTLGERYLSETRKIDVTKLSPSINDALRFHPRCIFGPGEYHPCIIALMRDPLTDALTGIQRVGLELAPDNKVIKINRMALGRMGAVKLWPTTGEGRLIVGEGIETVLAAATRSDQISYDVPLQPAWATLSADALGRFPLVPNVERLIILVDHDPPGKTAASLCTGRYERAGRNAVQLMPDEPGFDFNDIVMAE